MKTHGRIALAVLALLGLAFAVFLRTGRAEGDGEKPPKIGTVDLSRVFKKYSLTRTLAKDLREWKIAQEESVEKKKKDVLGLRDSMASMSGDAARDAHGSMVKLNRELTQLLEGLEGEYARRVLENDRTIYRKVCLAVEAVAAEHGYALVFQANEGEVEAPEIEAQAFNIKSRAIPFGAAEMDLTDIVLERLEKEEKK